MEEKTLRILEFDKVIERLSAHATSAPGREYCMRLKPSSNYRHIAAWQKNTTDALGRINLQASAPSFRGLSDITPLLGRLGIGASLSASELLKISALLSACERAKSYGGSPDEHEDSLSEIFSMLEPLTHICREISRVIIDEDTIADDASPELYEVRRSIARTESDIHSTMSSKLNSLRDCLSDAVITQRDGRWCLPVRSEYKSRVPGIVHDASSTGLTLFIEPQAVVSLNNTLRELRIKEQHEIRRVLDALSARLAPCTDVIKDDIKLMSRLDMIFAKALYSAETAGTEPSFTRDRSFEFRNARHPLIAPDRVVPVSISIGRDYDMLIVTGPNTGGKTVSLKTAGLLSLMAQAGLHIPADEGSSAGIYSDIYADIGDEQSIEQSLSTFSSHMTSIVHILDKASAASLCLFDELGSGTDPTEGAALGTAILDRLHKRHIRTMATTHYAEIKIYALETEGIENAACEFDIDSLRPTYRLLTGIPGRSNAFAISERLGLDPDIIDSARQRLSADSESFEKLIQKLNDDRAAAEKARAEADRLLADATRIRESIREREARLDRSRDRILEDARREAQRILKSAKATADEAIKGISSLKSSDDHAEAEKHREKLRKSIEENSVGGGLTVKGPSRPVSPRKVKPGDTVRIATMGGTLATVSSLPDRDGNISVRIGAMQSRVKIKDIEFAGEDAAERRSSPGAPGRKASGSAASLSSAGRTSVTYDPKSMSVSPEVNLIGMTVDEAMYELEKYLDDAYMAGLPEVRIVHGRGTGALRNMVQTRLRKLKYIEGFRQGAYGEGDTGVTIAKFRQ